VSRLEFPVFTHGRRDVAKIALTFDDGPNPPRTEQVLNILERTGVRATFFLIGKWVDRWPRSVERIAQAGHVIGNQSFTHARGVSDYDRAESAIGHVTGHACAYGRAHFFDYPAYALWSALEEDSVLTIDADVNPKDFALSTANEIVEATLEHSRLGNGSIIDLHDSSERDDDYLRLSRPGPMIQALARIIDRLQTKGYELVGLDELELVDPKHWRPGRSGSANDWAD
jgi:peptidoglycan/xylan/chitin deacetylase (PgdA/CDA1 family)